MNVGSLLSIAPLIAESSGTLHTTGNCFEVLMETRWHLMENE